MAAHAHGGAESAAPWRLKPDPAFYSGPNLNAYLSNTNRISGTDTFGVYEATFTVPPYIPPGPWNLVIQAGLTGSDHQQWALVGMPAGVSAASR